MQVFVTINNDGMMINASVSVNKWLMKVYIIKDIFRILVIVNVNVINHVGKYWNYESCKCRKRLEDKLVEECTETVEEVKIASKNMHK